MYVSMVYVSYILLTGLLKLFPNGIPNVLGFCYMGNSYRGNFVTYITTTIQKQKRVQKTM